MTTPSSPLAAAARDLKARHGALLAGGPSFTEELGQRAAVAALDEARDRLRGGGQRAGQMSLDLRAYRPGID